VTSDAAIETREMRVRDEEQHGDDAQRQDSSDEPETGAAFASFVPHHSW